MKVFLVFLCLFILEMCLLEGIDLYNGDHFPHLLMNIKLSKTELVGEDYVLIFLFTVPFGVAKIGLQYMENLKKKRNQEQNAGQNTSN
ncbi:hypothetical protein [Bacillus sp. AFS041924]|uniref:hypothetical protein n=1 Tax=Bacillus sp. AFS041924 TaxID=2033503 RepID=UPI000BFC8F0A|nr:hypothetical protein [Bacillus sp. AFS041924]PGS52676.1 hypothetical protein COC46_09485 [Bacillus sp. AFS041924]